MKLKPPNNYYLQGHDQNMKLCIYYTKEHKDKLTEMMYRYNLSRSTIITYLLFIFTKYVMKEQNGKEKLESLGKEYKYKQKDKRTYINLRKETIAWASLNSENLTKTFTNIVGIYCNKDIDKYISNKKQYYNDLNQKLQKEKEPNWNYDQFRRQMAYYEKHKKTPMQNRTA